MATPASGIKPVTHGRDPAAGSDRRLRIEDILKLMVVDGLIPVAEADKLARVRTRQYEHPLELIAAQKLKATKAPNAPLTLEWLVEWHRTIGFHWVNRTAPSALTTETRAKAPSALAPLPYPCRRLCFTISIACALIFLRNVFRFSPNRSAALIWLPPQALSAIAISGASTRSITRW